MCCDELTVGGGTIHCGDRGVKHLPTGSVLAIHTHRPEHSVWQCVSYGCGVLSLSVGCCVRVCVECAQSVVRGGAKRKREAPRPGIEPGSPA